MSLLSRQPVGLWLCCLLVISQCLNHAWAITYLRTARIDSLDFGAEWPGQRDARQLLGLQDCTDDRWGLLCGRVQLLVQIGPASDHHETLQTQLHADKAVICGYLPHDTWLVLARLEDLHSPVYRLHTLVPYLPEYKIAPEWHPVLELIHQERQHLDGVDHPDAGQQHLQLHRRVVEHRLLQQLQLHESAALHASHHHQDGLAQQLTRSKPAKMVIGVHFPHVPQAESELLGYNTEVFSPAAAAAADWQQPLADLLTADGRCKYHMSMCQPELIARGAWELDVAVCPQDLADVLYWLSNQATVHWLAPRSRLFLQNSVASMIVQDNGVASTTDYTKPDTHYFWQAGLDGKDQIIGIGDSGIDMHSCFFNDPANPFSPPTDGDTWFNPNHRKVVMYWGLADSNFKDLVGHGTHTSGSLAGFNPEDPTSRATGAAKSAKLVFADLSRTAGGDVNAPQDVAQNYYPKMYAAGARVFSDSWGSTSPVYDFQSSRVDAWLHEHQDSISHFAAGNYGENDDLDTTITSPATAKNVVTVGATKSLTPNYLSQTIAPVYRINVDVRRTGRSPQYISVRLVRAEFGGDGSNLSGRSLRVVRADPPNACGALTDASGKYKDAIVLARRGQCFFVEKMAAASAAGAAAVVIINDRAMGYFKMDSQMQDGADGQSSSITLLSLPQRMGEELWALFDNSESITATIERYTDTWEAFEDIAAFSSFGPTADGRIKPDVVCPGELVSASSSDNSPTDTGSTCNVGRKSGTSMATPMVAGHAAIIRQYFLEGYYPSGTATGSDAYTPSGPLVKAVMMGGACDMKGNTEQYLPLEESPSFRQGFGRLCLCSSLRLAGKCETKLQVVDRVPIKSQDTHKYCLRTIGGDMRIMLTWYDPPAQLSAATTLVNNLDLTVKSAGMGGQVLFGNHGQLPDVLNNAERVWLKNVPAGGLEITVTATISAATGTSQNYTLVVQGSFDGVLASPYNPDKSAQALPMAGCTAEQMLAAAPPVVAAAPTVVEQTMAVTSNTNLAAVPPVVTEAAAASNVTGSQPAATVAGAVVSQPSPAGAADTAQIVPPPAITEPTTPTTASGAPNQDALIGMLIGAMQSPAAATPADTAPGVPAAVAPQGRRLTWVPDPSAVVSIKVPRYAAQLLTACGMQQQRLGRSVSGHSVEDTYMHLPLMFVLAVSLVCAAAAVLFVGYSVSKYRLARSASLTSAIAADMSHQKRRGQQVAEQLKEALVQDADLAARLGSTVQQQRPQGRCDTSRSSSTISVTTSGSLGVDTSGAPGSNSSSSAPESPVPSRAGSVAGLLSAPPGIRPAADQQQWSMMLPGTRSCPASTAGAQAGSDRCTGSPDQQLTAPAATADGGGSSAVYGDMLQQLDHMWGLPPEALSAVCASTGGASTLDALRHGTRSFSEQLMQQGYRQQQTAKPHTTLLFADQAAKQMSAPLPPSAAVREAWVKHQQRHQDVGVDVQRARSCTIPIAPAKDLSDQGR